MRTIFAGVLLFVMLLAAGPAQATILTFDDLPGTGVPISSYGGLSWSTYFYHLDGSLLAYAGTGYDHGRVSPNHVAYNAWENVVAVSDNVFDFNGAWLTGAWNDGLNVKVEGWLDAVKKYDQTVTVNTAGATWFGFEYLDVNRLVFSSEGGTPNPIAAQRGEGHHFAMDNFTFDQEPVIPEPASLVVWSLLAAAGIGFTYWRRKRAA